MLQNNNQNNFSIMKVCIIQGGGDESLQHFSKNL